MMVTTQVLALSGGVGGAKLALGLSCVLPPGALTVVANVADDFEHLGLAISPDIDTLMYVLGGIDDSNRGWGRRDETWTFMNALSALGGETWFKLGDGDLATHVERTRRLKTGESLSQITADFCSRLGIRTRVVPATDDRIRTRLSTSNGWLEFQDYFVRQQCAPVVAKIDFEGAAVARPHPAVLDALRSPSLKAVVICPSNPLISIDPILAMPILRKTIAECTAPVIAVSPIIGGKAIKGPTAKMMAELGSEVSAASVARHYDGLIDAYIVDVQDEEQAAVIPLKTFAAPTLMRTIADREALARHVLAVAETIGPTR
jgi:LPPG:FO 2-phospho-L-lactate transferase